MRLTPRFWAGSRHRWPMVRDRRESRSSVSGTARLIHSGRYQPRRDGGRWVLGSQLEIRSQHWWLLGRQWCGRCLVDLGGGGRQRVLD